MGDVAGEPHLVGGDQHGHPGRRQLPDHLQDLPDQLGVQRAGDLVEQHELRVHGQGPDDGHPLLLASREPVGILAPLVGQAEPVE